MAVSSGIGEKRVVTLPDGTTMRFCLIEPGTFFMGSRTQDGDRDPLRAYADEEPVHRVSITAPFWIGETPVTQHQFATWVEAEGIDHANGFPGQTSHPAESMDWYQANAFCGWLTAVIGDQIPPGYRADLPAEAQWEYACRAGTQSDYNTGDGIGALEVAGWFDGNSGGKTHPVQEKVPNAWGLYDMHGNVWEWCRDAWDAEVFRKRADGEPNPEVPEHLAPSAEEDSDVQIFRKWSVAVDAIKDGWEETHRPTAQRIEEWTRGLTEKKTGRPWIPIAKALGRFLGGVDLAEEDWHAIETLKGWIDSQIPKENVPARVIRGGGWNAIARYCRSAYRYRWAPTLRSGGQGFRVCLVSGSAVPSRQKDSNNVPVSRPGAPLAGKGE